VATIEKVKGELKLKVEKIAYQREGRLRGSPLL